MKQGNRIGKILGMALVPVILLLLLPSSFAGADEIVSFPDPNLEAAIRDAIGKPTGDIYQSDLDGLTLLDAKSRNIGDLTGLEYCTSLISLLLSVNQISDISPLANLTNLATLYLNMNQISNISPLANLTNLATLDVTGNQISNISPLANLTSLTTLDLSHNQISNTSPVANLTNLTTLDLGFNPISNISSLASLTDLILLDITETQTVDVSSLANLWSLSQVFLCVNDISDISPLANLTNLFYLELRSNQISDVSPLANNPGLSEGDYVRLSYNPLSTDSINIYIPQLQARGVTVVYDAPSNQAPNQPTNVSPPNGATGINLTLTLQSSAFSDPNVGDTHAASRWQIRTSSGTYANPVFDSGTDFSNLTSITISSGTLNANTVYYWHVRHQDNNVLRSSYSAETSFITISAPTDSIETATGTGTAYFTASNGTIEDLQAVPAPSPLPRGVKLPHGTFTFEVTGLTPGQSVTLTVELPDPVPTRWVWWKYDDGVWSHIPISRTTDPRIITVTLVDGGIGDFDDVPGQITDPGGPGNPGSVGWETYPINKVRVLLPWIALFAAIAAGVSLVALRHRRAQS